MVVDMWQKTCLPFSGTHHTIVVATSRYDNISMLFRLNKDDGDRWWWWRIDSVPVLQSHRKMASLFVHIGPEPNSMIDLARQYRALLVGAICKYLTQTIEEEVHKLTSTGKTNIRICVDKHQQITHFSNSRIPETQNSFDNENVGTIHNPGLTFPAWWHIQIISITVISIVGVMQINGFLHEIWLIWLWQYIPGMGDEIIKRYFTTFTSTHFLEWFVHEVPVKCCGMVEVIVGHISHLLRRQRFIKVISGDDLNPR